MFLSEEDDIEDKLITMEGGIKSEERPSLAFYTNTTCSDLDRVEGESSVTSVMAEDCDDLSVSVAEEGGGRDGQHKRSKVNAGSRNNQYSTTWSRDSDSSVAYLNKCFNICPSSSTSVTKTELPHHLDYPDGMDEDGVERGSPKTEKEEVRLDLTDDLLHIVLSFMRHSDLCRAATVCRQWRVASTHEDLWKCLNFEDSNMSMRQFKDICLRYPNATELNIIGATASYLLVPEAISSLRNLEVLNLGKAQLGDAFFYTLEHCCNLLRSLNVTDTIIGNRVQNISINHDRLKQLHLIRCSFRQISLRCPVLETLSLKGSNMIRRAQLNCPLLHDLDLVSCHSLSRFTIDYATGSCPLLESIDMSNCSSLENYTFHEIARSFVNLHFLNASYCPNVTLKSVRLPMLTVLKLGNCDGITSTSMVAVSYSTMLEVLDLDNCSLLTSVSLDLARLRHIRLAHCCQLADLNLRALMLSSIMVSNCSSLHQVNLTSNLLKKLSLQKHERLKTLSLQCPSLQEVDLTDCKSLEDSICETFSGDGGFPMLKSLVLDNCELLRAVQFCSSSLVSLSLASCCEITTLELSCPYLEQLCLDGCHKLERASFNPVVLQSLLLGICPKLSELIIVSPKLVVLELKGCGVLSKASISCPLLTSLDASFCSQLKDEFLTATAASCPLIESLILMSCPIGYDELHSLCWLPRLTILDLSYTVLINLTPVFESCLQLKVLKLQACKRLTDSSLKPLYKHAALPALCELDLSYVSICQSAIEELLACCTHLTHVNLNGCINMHDLNWSTATTALHFSEPSPYALQCKKVVNSPVVEEEVRLLQILNCVGCLNIQKVLIPPTAHCLHLSSLNLSLSTNLKEVNIACLNLCVLNLSHCVSLEILKLNCPKLTRLFLQSCNIDLETLEVAVSQCYMLETLDIYSKNLVRLRGLCPSLKGIYSSGGLKQQRCKRRLPQNLGI